MGASESANIAEEDASSVTTVLRRGAPVWWWLRENFRPPSLAALAGVILTAAAWIWNQHSSLEELAAQQKGLATSQQVKDLAATLEAIRTDLDDHGERIARIERYLDQATKVAQEPPRPRPRRHPTP